MKRLSFLAFVFAAMTSSTQAADLGSRPDFPAPVTMPAQHDWTGLYVGAQAGWQSERGRYSDIGVGGNFGFDTFGSTTKSGEVSGLHAGFGYQIGPAVLGFEGDAELTTLSYAWQSDLGFGFDQKITAQGSLRGRLGYAFDRLLIYGTVGFALADVATVYKFSGIDEKISNVAYGWTGGGGLQFAFNHNWSAKVEYRYTNLGTIKNIPTVAWVGYHDSHELTSHATRFGISYTFAAAPAAVVARY